MESGGQQGAVSHPPTLPLTINCRPHRKTCGLQMNTTLATILLTPQEGGRFFSALATAQPMRNFHISANETPLHFQLPICSNGLLVYNSPSQIPLSSIKEPFCSLISGFAHGLPQLFCPGLQSSAIPK